MSGALRDLIVGEAELDEEEEDAESYDEETGDVRVKQTGQRTNGVNGHLDDSSEEDEDDDDEEAARLVHMIHLYLSVLDESLTRELLLVLGSRRIHC